MFLLFSFHERDVYSEYRRGWETEKDTIDARFEAQVFHSEDEMINEICRLDNEICNLEFHKDLRWQHYPIEIMEDNEEKAYEIFECIYYSFGHCITKHLQEKINEKKEEAHLKQIKLQQEKLEKKKIEEELNKQKTIAAEKERLKKVAIEEEEREKKELERLLKKYSHTSKVLDEILVSLEANQGPVIEVKIPSSMVSDLSDS